MREKIVEVNKVRVFRLSKSADLYLKDKKCGYWVISDLSMSNPHQIKFTVNDRPQTYRNLNHPYFEINKRFRELDRYPSQD